MVCCCTTRRSQHGTRGALSRNKRAMQCLVCLQINQPIVSALGRQPTGTPRWLWEVSLDSGGHGYVVV